MPDLSDIDAIEARHIACDGEPSLGEAFALLRERWQGGQRDRETALRLLFLGWYSCAEPAGLTGLPTDGTGRDAFLEAFAAMGGETSADPELLFAVGYMAGIDPWCLGDEAEWEGVAERCRARSKALRPEGFTAADFSGRGTYGEYFTHIVGTRDASSG